MTWPMGKVADIADVISGFAFKSSWFGSGEDRVIRIGDLKNSRIDIGGSVTVDAKVNAVRDIFKIRKGDILMALSGATVGKIAIADDEAEGCYLNQRVAIIRSKSVESENYLKFVFSGVGLERLLLHAGGAAQPNLSPKDLAAMEIPLPPLAEQQRIAAILDRADAIRRKRQQATQLADDFLRAVFLDMFGDPVTNPRGWEVAELADVVKEGTIITYGIVQAGPEVSDGIPYVRTGDFKSGLLSSEGFARTHPDIAAKFSRSRVETGDLIYCIRASIGSVDIVPEFLNGANLTQGTARISPGENILGEYLVEFLRCQGFRDWVDRHSKGATFKEITLGTLRQAPVLVPPLEIQRKFKNIRQSVLLAVKGKMEKMELPLFEALSQKAFNGNL